MKAITLYQPWASLIACGAKQHETRGWRAPDWLIGQRLAIHAGKTLVMIETDDDLGRLLKRQFGEEWAFDVPRGAVVAITTLEGCYRTEERQQHATPEDLICGDWHPGRWAWHLIDVRALSQPARGPGGRGIWEWYPPSAQAHEARLEV